ncbi:hypothetical protein E2C01_001051 [Portunus trituberculatus]|uniref:Uncharacterized protein n=1 Tax=Portunus trituberculatus TaxID=210409 RepID=A0A5B7CIE0_PORTR|nr:hypothetical protein [Portunus trituberculatus]
MVTASEYGTLPPSPPYHHRHQTPDRPSRTNTKPATTKTCIHKSANSYMEELRKTSLNNNNENSTRLHKGRVAELQRH